MCIQEIIISKSLYIKHIICFIFPRSYVHPENIKNIKKKHLLQVCSATKQAVFNVLFSGYQ